MSILISITLLLLSFFLLALIVDEFFVKSLDKFSERLNISSEVAGATLMAVGSSAPELFTSLIAVFRVGSESDIGAGTIVGSAIFNILVIIGASAMFRKAVLTWQPVMRDLLFYCAAIILLLISFWDGKITMPESLAFVGLYMIYVFCVTQWSKWFKYKVDDPVEIAEEESERNKILQLFIKPIDFFVPDPVKHYVSSFVISIGLIGFLSYVMVESAVNIAHYFSVSPAVIGLTILAAGTSVPDLISSTIVAKRGRGDMAIANAVGSNIFDILFGLGVPWLLVTSLRGNTIHVGTENLLSSVFLLFATVVAVFFVLAVRKWEVGKRAGIVLILMYLAYIIYNILRVTYGY